jgi:hypothetical protein
VPVINNVPYSYGLRSYAMSQTGVNYGIVGASRSPSGFGRYFYNNGGGGEASSAHYAINYSVGQSVVGLSSSAIYQTSLGFWQLFARYLRLPLVLK